MPRLHHDAMLLNMKAATKEAALRELAGVAATVCGRFTEATLLHALLEREAVGSTGLGNGVAIPHGKLEGLDEILLCFGRSRTGIDFDAIDNRPAHLFVMLLSPASKAGEYLKTLAMVSKILKQPGNRQRLLDSTSRDEIAAIFAA
ncbi:PTS sugar transporter subunit IIA [Desulfobulbus sp.]|uniref:PTS sugar transporter subunit IIA n=1 Tax=Desulfobulbus sp. TaxID=895 RepID=UPI00286F6C8E|nr:PTS sugar transporter subunit IIA [Desulfobulbus sp.]